MRIPVLLSAAALMGAASALAPQAAHAQSFSFSALLNSAQERPINNTSAVVNTSGEASAFFDQDLNRLTITLLSVRNMVGNITGAHIHVLPATADPLNDNGPIRFDFFGPTGLSAPIPNSGGAATPGGNGTSFVFPQIVFNNPNAADIQSIRNGFAYFNVHTQTFPGGQIRGNIAATAAIPEPGTLALLAGVLLPVVGLARRRCH